MHEHENNVELLFVSGKLYDWTDCYEINPSALK